MMAILRLKWRRLADGAAIPAVAIALLIAPAGCDRDESGATAGGSVRPAVVRETRDDVAIARIEVAKDIITTADTAAITVVISLPDGFTVEDVDLQGAAPEDWTISHRDRKTDLEQGRSIHRYEYGLDPFLPGSFEIDPVAIRYRSAEEGGAEAVMIETAPVVIEVKSVLPPGDPGTTPAEAKGVVEPPEEPVPWWFWVAPAAVLVLLMAAIAMLIRRRGRGSARDAPPLPAEVAALRELDELEAENLPGRGLYKPFYQSVSNIMRRYVESRFGLHAPDRTTEEFLEESRASRRFSGEDLTLFERFLQHCDMVKFAEFQPTKKQADETMRTVRAFVLRTTPSTSSQAEGERRPAVAVTSHSEGGS